VQEPLSPGQVKKLVVAILANGTLWFTRHAYEELDNDNLTEVDVVNTLRGGRVQPGELVAGTYRYRVETSRIAVVVAFRSETWAIVITAWRFKR